MICCVAETPARQPGGTSELLCNKRAMALDSSQPHGSMTLLEIWDFISGVGDSSPFDKSFKENVTRLLMRELGNSRFRILDLGAGSGNPSIGLPKDGHDVQMVDIDRAFTDAASRRAERIGAQVKIACADWRDYIPKQLSRDEYDVILCMGNALGYQDTWPDRELPRCDLMKSLTATLRLCRSVLKPGGLVVIEVPLEEPQETPRPYLQFHPEVTASTIGGMRSVWLVTCDPRRSSRTVDTMVMVPISSGLAEVRGRIVFRGWLLTRPASAAAAKEAGMTAHFQEKRLRSLFDTVVLRHNK